MNVGRIQFLVMDRPRFWFRWFHLGSWQWDHWVWVLSFLWFEVRYRRRDGA